MANYNDHTSEAQREAIVARLGEEAIALVSDAGTPLISDPGYKLVRDARAAGHAIYTLPGPSALLAALTLAGLPTDRFLFAGFLPPKAKARADSIAELSNLRDQLTGCIGCGCLSLKACKLRNPDDTLAAEGEGARLLIAGHSIPASGRKAK